MPYILYMDNIKSLYNRLSFKLMTPKQRVEYAKQKERERKRRLRNRTQKQKERARSKRFKQIEYNRKRATLRNAREKKWKARRKVSICKLKKGQTSKKIPFRAIHCPNCTKDAWKRSYQNYCTRKGKGKYVASCASCVYSI